MTAARFAPGCPHPHAKYLIVDDPFGPPSIGKGFLKELILRRDEELLKTFAGFGSNPRFLEDLHGLVGKE